MTDTTDQHLPVPDRPALKDSIRAVIDRLLQQPRPRPSAGEEAAAVIVALTSDAELDPIIVNLDSNTATRRGVCRQLTPNEAVLLYALIEAWPGCASLIDMARALWGANRFDLNTVRVMISGMRRKLAILDITIRNVHGVGYRLEYRVTL